MSIYKSLMAFTASARKNCVASYVNLEIPVDDYTFCTNNGTLVTVFKVHGMLNFPVADSSDVAFNEIELLLKILFKDKSHKVSWCYERDKGLVNEDIERMISSDRKTAKRIGLNVDSVFEEIKNVNNDDGLFHRSYFAIETNHKMETKDVIQDDFDLRDRLFKEMRLNLGDSPNPFRLIPSIINKHNLKVEEILNRFKSARIDINKVDCSTAISVMSSMLDPSARADGFSPHLAYDSMEYKKATWYNSYIATKKHPSSLDNTFANYTPEKLAEQISTQQAEEISDGILKIGSKYIAPIVITGFPKKDVIFNALLSEIVPEIPFRVNFLLSHASDIWFDIKRVLGGFTRWGHPDNKAFSEAVRERSVRQNNNETYCSLQIVFVTWANSVKEIIKNRDQLISSIEKWEGCQAKSDKGDAYEAFVASVPGATFDSPSTVGYPPIEAAAGMLPVTTEGRCWDNGILLFRTYLSNLVSPFSPQAGNQDYHLDVILARPRQGKGILSNSINLALLTKKGNTELPFETFVDVGPTSTGYGKFLQDSLPEGMKHLVEMMKIQMGGDFINPADIQFGLNKPLPEEKAFLSNFLMMLATDPSTHSVPSNMAGFIGTVIDETYKEKFDYKTGNNYVPFVNKELDDAIEKYRRYDSWDLEIDDFTKYYQLRDELFKQDDILLAKYCHVMSMPILSDFRETADGSDIIFRDYGNLPAIGTMTIPQYFALKIKEAVNKYSIFTRHSNKDFDSAKVKIIDVKPMIDTSSDEMIVQTGIFLLLARFIGCKDFVLNEDHVSFFSPLYRDFQKKRIMKIRALPKRVTYDEFHTSNMCTPFRNQIQFDVKEGPKWNTSVCVISHEPKDFGVLLKQSTNLFVLGSLPASSIRELDEIIGLTKEAKFIFNNRLLHGPRKGGSSFYLRSTLKSGIFEQVFRFPKGPVELWSYTTEKRDMPFRDRIIAKVGTEIARNVLSTIFPTGSAEKWFIAQEAKMENSDDLQESELDSSLIDQLEKSVLNRLTDDMLDSGVRKLRAKHSD